MVSDRIRQLTEGEPLTPMVAVKRWDDAKQAWLGVICQCFRDSEGREGIVVYDVGMADTQVEIDDWCEEALRTKPWEKKDEA